VRLFVLVSVRAVIADKDRPRTFSGVSSLTCMYLKILYEGLVMVKERLNHVANKEN